MNVCVPRKGLNTGELNRPAAQMFKEYVVGVSSGNGNNFDVKMLEWRFGKGDTGCSEDVKW